MTYAEQALAHAGRAQYELNNKSGFTRSDADTHASLAAAFASLAVSEQLARFEAVAVEGAA